MKSVEIKPVSGPLDATVRAPPSKAHTLRAIFLSSLARGKSVLKNPLLADDQLIAIEAMKKFGAGIDVEAGGRQLVVEGTDGALEAPEKVFVGNSGVSMRFLCSIAAITGSGGERIVLDGDARMRQRPIGELLEALCQLGGQARSLGANNCPPVEVVGKSLLGGTASIDSAKSSQFASSLLAALPLAPQDSVLKVAGEASSRPYVNITLDCIRAFGGKIAVGKNEFHFKGNQSYLGREYEIEGDYSSAAFFFQAAAVTGGKVRVKGLRRDSLQGDKRMLEFLRQMGCEVRQAEGEVLVSGPEELNPLDAELRDFPDIVMPLAVACAFAKGRSELRDVGHLRFKESDRLAALQEGLKRIGAKAQVEGNSLVIEGKKSKSLSGSLIRTFNDHRIAMAFAVAGLRLPGMRIENPECVGKSFPNFFEELASLGR